MKIKTLFCCLCMLLGVCSNLKAEEEPVVLRPEMNSEYDVDDRSLQIVPTASHDGRIVYIRTDWLCGRLYVEVEDANGMMVFAGMPDALGDTEYSLEVPGSATGIYTLWVLVDKTMYVGEFEVE